MHGKVGTMKKRQDKKEQDTESHISDISLAIQHQATTELSGMLKNHGR